jgi:hypothetical protein
VPLPSSSWSISVAKKASSGVVAPRIIKLSGVEITVSGGLLHVFKLGAAFERYCNEVPRIGCTA